jgi:hypothetical protein
MATEDGAKNDVDKLEDSEYTGPPKIEQFQEQVRIFLSNDNPITQF